MMDKQLSKILSVVIALLVGGYLGYYFTNSHYVSKEAEKNKLDNTALCRLELREGNRGEVKNKYIAILEYRAEDDGKDFCEQHMPNGIPDDTNITSLNSLQSEETYDEQNTKSDSQNS